MKIGETWEHARYQECERETSEHREHPRYGREDSELLRQGNEVESLGRENENDRAPTADTESTLPETEDGASTR